MAHSPPNPSSRSSMVDFDVIEKIGAGSYGTVLLVKRLADQNTYVIKRVAIAELPRNEQMSALMEVKVLSSSEHPNVVAYYDSFIEDGILHIVMEYCDKGDVHSLLKRARTKGLACLPEVRVWPMLVQMTLGLHYLHSRRVLHRDFKTGNVFLKSSESGHTVVKLGDLGVAKLLDTQSFAKTTVGTPYYLSPELVNDTPYNNTSDMWALGVVLYEMVTMQRPFEAKTQCALILKIVRGDFAPIPTENASSPLIDIITRLLCLDPTKRPSARKLLSHPIVQQELFALGLELPTDIQMNNPDQKVPSLPTRVVAPAKTSRHFTSARTENLAKPRKQHSVRQPHSQNRPEVSVDDEVNSGGCGAVRGGRVRGGGARLVSQRAQRSPMTAQEKARSVFEAAHSDREEKDQRQPSQGQASVGPPQQRPTVSDLLAMAHSCSHSSPRVGAASTGPEESDAPPDRSLHPHEDEIVDSLGSDVQSHEVEKSSTYNISEDQDDRDISESIHQVAEPKREETPGLEPKFGNDITELTASSKADSSSSFLDSSNVEEFLDFETSESPSSSHTRCDSEAGAGGAATREHACSDDEDGSAEYSDDAWEDDVEEDEPAMSSEGSFTLETLAASSRSRCIQLLGGAQVLSRVVEELGKAGSDISLPELVEKLQSACDHDRQRAHSAAMSLQRLLAAEAGLGNGALGSVESENRHRGEADAGTSPHAEQRFF